MMIAKIFFVVISAVLLSALFNFLLQNSQLVQMVVGWIVSFLLISYFLRRFLDPSWKEGEE